jgi:hypothetical protein
MRIRSRCSLLLGLAAAGALTTASAQAAPQRCGQLLGTEVVATASIKIVKQRVHRYPKLPRGTTGNEFVGSVFRGCSLPDGLVRRLGEAGRTYFYTRGDKPARNGLSGASKLSFAKPRGAWILRRSGSASLQASENSGEVVNVATGKRYLYWNAFDDGQSSIPSGPYCDTSPPLVTRLDATGLFAGVYAGQSENGTVHTVEAFTPSGDRKALDIAPGADIDPASLTSVAGTVSWVTAGTAKSTVVTENTPTEAPGMAPANCDA